MSKGVFLDLNGTLVLPLKPERLQDIVPIAGAIAAVARLTRADFVCPVVTVQSRIAKGLFTEVEFRDWFAGFAAAAREVGAELRGPYICPHRYTEPCSCKKPQLLLYQRAVADLEIDVSQSFVVGDAPEDIQAARAIGARGCLVRTGWAADPGVVAAVANDAAFVGPTIAEVVEWILSL